MWRVLWWRYNKIGLQWRIMLYVTAGLIVFSAIYAALAIQAVQESNTLVFQERLSVARALAHEIDERLAQIEVNPQAKSTGSTPGSPTDASSPLQNYLPISAQLKPLMDEQVPGYRVELLNEVGATVFSNIEGRPTSTSPHWRLIESYAKKRQGGTNVHSTPVGEHVIAFAPLSLDPWMVIIEQNADEALILPRQLQMQFLAFGIFTIVAGLGLAFVTTRHIVRPVTALIHASKEIARGNLDHPLDLTGGGEIGTLARAFDEMRVRLEESREEIARWNRELEERVFKRTRELTALVESSHALSSTLDLDALFEILINQARDVLPAAEGIALVLFERETKLLVVRSSYGMDRTECSQLRFRIGEAIAGKVFETQSPTLLITSKDAEAAQANFTLENREHFANAVNRRNIASALAVPLISKGTCLGVLVVYNFSAEGALNENDVPVLQALANQAATAIENARLYSELERKEEILTHLLEKVIEAQEDERKRIARELHDELGQTLTALTIDLQAAARHMPSEMSYLRRRLGETETLTTQTLKEMSQLILELRPSVLDDLGLVPAIRRYAENRLETVGTRVNVEAVGLKQRLPSSVETTLFRILQETINNAARYAHASRVDIRLKQLDGLIQVEVEDDGAGFDAEDAFKLKDGWRGLGLLGMRERATLLGGTLEIDSKFGRGTRVRVEIPWKQD